MNKNLSVGLNIIRLIACIIVFMLHSTIFEPQIQELMLDARLFFLYPSAWAGVWIFFITGGFLAGYGFSSGRYSYNRKSVIDYYKKRIDKIVIPVICFIIFCYLIVYPTMIKDLPTVLSKFITFRYKGNPGADGIGATWYVSTLLFFYLVCPVICYVFERLRRVDERIPIYLLLLFIILGAVSRYLAYKYKIDWNNVVYTPWYYNMDLFFGGIALSFFPKGKVKKINSSFFRYGTFVLFIIVVLINAFFQRKMAFEGDLISSTLCFYGFQSIYLVTISLFIITHWTDEENKNSRVFYFFDRIIKKVSVITFEFYLFHSLILYIWSGYVLSYVDATKCGGHLLYLLIIALITVGISIGYHKIFENSSFLTRKGNQ